MPQNRGYRGAAGPFSGSDAARFEVAPLGDAWKSFNANYLKGASRLHYPRINPPLTDQQVAERFSGSERNEEIPTGELPPPVKSHYTPKEVLKFLKLLSQGDISDEALEEYEQDANRMRAYAALAKQRDLTDEEQRLVDEVGARLAKEAQGLVAEDVGLDEAKRKQIGQVDEKIKHLAEAKSAVITAAHDEEQKRLEARSEAKTGEEVVAYFEKLSKDVGLRVAALKEEVKQDYPTIAFEEDKITRAAEVAKELADLKAENAKYSKSADAASAAIPDFQRLEEKAEAQRDAYYDEAKLREGEIAELEIVKSAPRAVNPRFASRANEEPKLLASAIELSRAHPAAENKVADAEFKAALGPKGPVAEFISFNLGHNRTGKKFFSREKLTLEWAEYARARPKVPTSPPWLLERRRQGALKDLFESTKVPSEFKLYLLKKGGYIP
jgi:hypothetical protein